MLGGWVLLDCMLPHLMYTYKFNSLYIEYPFKSVCSRREEEKSDYLIEGTPYIYIIYLF